MALLTLSVGSLMISQGMVGAQTDPGVGTDAPVDDDDDDDRGNASDSGPLLPVTPAVDTNPANAGNGGVVVPEPVAAHGFDQSLRLTLPPLACLLLKPVRQ